jgi:hypothetical protein
VSLLACWNAIYSNGRVSVDPPEPGQDSAADAARLAAAIVALDAEWRSELAFEPPALVAPVAAWAARLVRQACQFLVFREIEPDGVRSAMADPFPAAPSPEVCYSADLALRVLPDLLRLARAASPDDALVEALARLATAWPLSSVGEKLADADVSPFIDHPSLRLLYVDRILEQDDASRLSDVRVRAAVREAIGAHAELAPPAVAAALRAEA